MSKVRILVVDDEKMIRRSLAEYLSRSGYAVLTAADVEAAFRIIRETPPDVLLLDVGLPHRRGEPPRRRGGVDALAELRAGAASGPVLAADTQVIMITASGSSETAVEAFKLGADDYVTKPFDSRTLEHTIRRCVEKQRLQRQVNSYHRTEQRRYDMARIVGRSRAITDLLDLTGKIAVSDATTVLLTGESGTGKDLVARAIHYGSPRRDRPFMAINCTAIIETLLESELMGHEKGAFTDARSLKHGLLELADGGTVFLDEIGDMQRSLQAKLLRTIEDRTIRRVGGTETLHVDIRIIAATNRDLEQAVRDGDFRDDLYYRLKVFPLHMPPLRERPDDIPLLTRSFVDHFNEQYRRNVSGVTPEAMDVLCRHDWPGNVRELRNVVERAIILQTNGEIGIGDLPADLTRHGPDVSAPVPRGFELPSEGIALESVERDLIRQALDRTNRNQTRAARLLHLSRDALRYRMKKFDLG